MILTNKSNTAKALPDGEEGRFVASEIFEQRCATRLPTVDSTYIVPNAQSRAMEDALCKRDILYVSNLWRFIVLPTQGNQRRIVLFAINRQSKRRRSVN
jgi:hypothetical protein